MTLHHMHEDHCSRWGGIPQKNLTEFNRRAIGLLCRGFGLGPWNIPVNWGKVKWGSERHTEFVTSGHGLSTWDFNRLTRLVIGAHDEMIRVEISPKAFRYLSIEMWPRESREGRMSKRHPTIEEAVASYRGTPDPARVFKSPLTVETNSLGTFIIEDGVAIACLTSDDHHEKALAFVAGVQPERKE